MSYKQEQVKLCPFRTTQTIYHNDRNNIKTPSFGINKRVDFDVVNTEFEECILGKCMAYDERTHKCKACEK